MFCNHYWHGCYPHRILLCPAVDIAFCFQLTLYETLFELGVFYCGAILAHGTVAAVTTLKGMPQQAGPAWKVSKCEQQQQQHVRRCGSLHGSQLHPGMLTGFIRCCCAQPLAQSAVVFRQRGRGHYTLLPSYKYGLIHVDITTDLTSSRILPGKTVCYMTPL